ncbi:DNA alkylation repair protein [Paenibacillus thiaminolyticus]|uniref:DNA alkylation repair protein n=1 Tax=Paenibacillus thiaminolyticus TaxID=49283 RepID=A0A3A3GMN3_PANTH|nr:DNA alkylation repair protein [Paenibacillus thiaminolyticus]RJG26560.1 DNA alkylation repair protein [Paenibacillus thiaminolyticus]
MTVEDILQKLEAMGSEQTKKTFLRHGAQEPLFGVKVGDLKKLVTDVKKDQALARALYETGNSDAMYLAGLTVNPKTMDRETLQAWAKRANWYLLAEYTVAGVAAESPHALALAREWMKSDDEMIATCGWSTYANYISMTQDEDLDLEEIRRLLQQIAATIHSEKNRVRYTMNMFVIVVGSYVRPLHEEAVQVAGAIGKVQVHMGQTACKVPDAVSYIEKTVAASKLGTRKKTCIC